MSLPSKITNPFLGHARKSLTRKLGLDTLMGGEGGHDDTTPEALSASSAEEEYDLGVILATSLDASLALFRATLVEDREAFDDAMHELTSVVGLWNDAKPKA